MNIDSLLTLPQSTPISVLDLTLSIVSSFLVCALISLLYRHTHKGLNYENSFLATLTLTGPVVGLVIMLIGSNIALSLGLAGALSIIRFRNVIKDSRDMAFLFWVIAVGLGSGTLNFKVVIVSSILIALFVLLLSYLKFGDSRYSDCILVLRGGGDQPADRILEAVSDFAKDSNLRSFEVEEDHWEIVIELQLSESRLIDQSTVLNNLRSLENVRHASIMTPIVNLPL